MEKKYIYKIFAFILFFSLLFYLTYLRVNSPIGIMGDTGLLYSLFQSVHDGNGPHLPLYASISDTLFKYNIPSISPELVCQTAQLPITYTQEQQNFFSYHSYLILYPLSVLIYFIDAPYVVQGINLFSFLSFIAISFYILLKNNHKIGFILLSCILISFSPQWSFSIIGQPYIDKIFLPFGILLFYFVDKRNLFWVIILTLVSCFINEKVAIYIGVFLVLSSFILLNKKYFKFYLTLLLVGLITLITVFIYIKFYLNNSYYSVSIPFSINEVINYLKIDRNLNGILSLLIICSPFLFFSIIYKWKYALIALTMLIPNILGNIGGAEKTNFYTHYHILYFPFLIYPFLLGFSEFLKTTDSKIIRRSVATLMILCLITYNCLSIRPDQKISINIKDKNSYLFTFYQIKKSQFSFRKIQKILENSLSLSSTVSSVEAGQAYLYRYRNLSFYPLNLTNSDYILVIKGENNFKGYFGYNGVDEQRKTDNCLNEIIGENYDIKNIVYLSPDLLLLKNKSRN
jgi:hypothetical protein